MPHSTAFQKQRMLRGDYDRRRIHMELVIAFGLGIWFVIMGAVAAYRIIKDYKE